MTGSPESAIILCQIWRLVSVFRGEYADKIQELADTEISLSAWDNTRYQPARPNYKDRIISIAEELAYAIVKMLQEHVLSDSRDLYLERHVNVVLGNQW